MAAMGLLFVAGVGITWWADAAGTPALAALGVDQSLSPWQAGGNMEGKEVRFGVALSALFATITTAASCGAVIAMHDSLMPLAGMVPLVNIMLGEVIVGGVGAGLYGMLVFVILTVFIAGLMVGRTPEYVGKKIEAREVKLAVIAILVFPVGILGLGAVGLLAGASAIQDGGPHGLTELLYAYASATGNNGSAFAGFGANTVLHNTLLGIAMLLGRFVVIVPTLAIAGAVAAKKTIPPSSGTFPTHGWLFVALLVAVRATWWCARRATSSPAMATAARGGNLHHHPPAAAARTHLARGPAMTARILVVDDEAQIRKFLRISLGANGYEVLEAETGAAGIEAARSQTPDLLVLDLGLPDMDGQEVVSAVREFSGMPIIILSVRADEFDKVEALDRGANDFVVKPFGIAELMARVRVVLRSRTPQAIEETLVMGEVTSDLARRVVTKADEEIHLSKKEWDLLSFLARHPDHVLTHRQILKEVWGPAHVDDTAYLRVYVNQLRQKLEANPGQPHLIVTDPGVGYRLKRGE